MIAMVLLSACLWALPSTATAVAPHVATTADTDTCAICHRGHTAASTITVEPSGLGDPVNALIVGTFSGAAGDTELCFSCHNGLGSVYDSLSDFETSSGHALAPETSPYGPSPKGCNGCHDSHGSARDENDDPFPALLEALNAQGDPVRRGDVFCGTCHVSRPGNVFPGVEVWDGTAHEQLFATTEGTRISCSGCHDSHGSNIAPSLLNEIVPSGSSVPTSVAGNNRSLCYLCHTVASSTYGGRSSYAVSAHGVSAKQVPVEAEWAADLPEGSPDADRRAGECQNCHSAMGANDGAGSPIPALLRAKGAALCYRCHGANSAIAADIESIYPPAPAAVTEIFAAYGGATNQRQYSLAHYYTRESATSTVLMPPRPVVEGGLTTTTVGVGPVAAGDVDGDTASEVVVSRSGTPDVWIVRRSALAGVTTLPGPVTLLSEPDFLAIGDVLPDTSGYPEVVAATDATVRVYRWNGAFLAPISSVSTTHTITGLTTGDVVGTSGDDIVATTTGAATQDNLVVVVTGGSGALSIDGSYLVGAHLPRGPDAEDLDGTGKDEIAFVLGNENQDILRIWNGTGGELAVAGSTSGNQHAQRALIHDVMWGISGTEVSVTFADENDGARVDVFPRSGAGLGAPVTLGLINRSNPAEMTAADADGDGHDELVVSLAGSFDDRVPPGLDIVQTNAAGTTITGYDFYQAAGVESADTVPGQAWVAAVELGPTGASKHAVDGVPGVHVSTEAAGFARHVVCVDCHNTHEATSTVSVAPDAQGPVEGAWGVSVENAPANDITFTEKRGIDYEYELCLKCHDDGSWSSLGETRDIASEVDTRNASFHAVEGEATSSEVIPGSFVGGGTTWTNSSRVYCTDCHGNSNGSESNGPHASAQAPLLRAPYLGLPSSSADGLCFDCHLYEVYVEGSADVDDATGSRFHRDNNPRYLHSQHVSVAGIGCAACHTSHGGSLPHLIREDAGYTHVGAGGGECTNACHGGATRAYTGR